MMKSKSATCDLDPAPTSFLKLLVDFLLPFLSHIVNLSFKEGCVPSQLKYALILPLLKKLGLDWEMFNNYRPVSNLPFLGKLIERVSAKRLLSHMSLHDLQELFQSAYKEFHSTETSLVKIHNDILSALDDKKSVLLHQLQSDIGISGTAVKWFKSYLSERQQSVRIGDTRSEPSFLECGVPQGSVLGPILVTIYTSPLGKILQAEGVHYL